MSRDINKLKEPFKTQIKRLVKMAKDKDIPILITDTTRTLAEQKRLVKEGKSKTLDSKHLTGEAVDIAFIINGKLSYLSGLYEKLYQEVIKSLSFVIWPFRDKGWSWDRPHFQYDKNKVIINNVNEEEYKKRIRELNTELGTVTRERDNARRKAERVGKIYLREKANHLETLDKLISCEKEREEIAGRGRKAISLLNKIKNFFA